MNSWLGLENYEPQFVNTVEALEPYCAAIRPFVVGHNIERVSAAYNLFYDDWDLDMPILLEVDGHCIDIMNTKFDETTIGIDRILPSTKIEESWEELALEWREFKVDGVVGSTIEDLKPCVEDDPKYANHGLLCGVEFTLSTGVLRVANGLDTNIFIVSDSTGTKEKAIKEGQ